MEVDDKSEEIDTDDSEWKLQRNQKKNLKKRARRKSCSENENEYLKDLKEREQSHEDKLFKCDDCDKKFEMADSFMKHKQIHKQAPTEPDKGVT